MHNKRVIQKLILDNTVMINQLKSDVDRLAKIRDSSPEIYNDWKHACHRMLYEYDQFAFPHYGLHEGVERLKQNDSAVIDLWIIFLETDPYFFRSGYIKNDILRFFKKLKFDEKQLKSLNALLIQTVQEQRTLFRKYCLFAKYIYDEELKNALIELYHSDNTGIKRRAKEMLTICDPKTAKNLS